jgi:hypothetical protein
MELKINSHVLYEAPPAGSSESDRQTRDSPRLIFAEGAAHAFFDEPMQAPCCGEPRLWFINRDGRTLCSYCDDERQVLSGRAA